MRSSALRIFGGAVVYRELSLPRLPTIDRRRVHAALALPASDLKISGEVKYYESLADSGNTFGRGFCPKCGSRVFGKTSGMPQLMFITAGSLDDPSRFKPSMDFFTSSAQRWDHMDPALPKFTKLPR